MKDQFWAMYVEYIDSEFYYWHYRARATFWNNAINMLSCITSAVGISTWLIWKQLPWLWAIVVGISQGVNAIRHILPFQKQISSVSLMLPELKILLSEIDRDWNSIQLNELSDIQINQRIFTYNERYLQLENKHIKDTSFPRKKWCQKKAEIDRVNFFNQHYSVKSVTDKILI